MKRGDTEMMLYELDDIEKRALVMEIKPDPVDEARELLSKATPGPWFDWDAGEWIHEPKHLLSNFEDSTIIARAPDLLSALIARIESQEEDIRFLGDRLEVQADVMSKVVAERNQLREATLAMREAIEATHEWVQSRAAELRGDNNQALYASAKEIAAQLRAALSPKGEQK